MKTSKNESSSTARGLPVNFHFRKFGALPASFPPTEDHPPLLNSFPRKSPRNDCAETWSPNNRKRIAFPYKILKNAGIEQKGVHSFRHTFASRLVNGVKQPDGSLLCLLPKQVADLLGHSTSEITEMYYVKRDNTRLVGITDGFAL